MIIRLRMLSYAGAVEFTRIAQNVAKYARHYGSLQLGLGAVEKMGLRKTWHSNLPQLFILGLPRSGTTLIYQYIVHRLKVAYFTNGVGKYRLSPCIVSALQHRLYGEYHSDFKSSYGKVFGPVAPREAGGFWGRFFDRDEYIRFEELSVRDIHTLRNSIACMQKTFGNVPFVNKNVKHMLRIEALKRTFPDSYFLYVTRDLEEVALSVLRARYENLGNPRDWWSVKPPNHVELANMPLAEQVVYQLITLQKKLEDDLLQIPAKRVLQVDYARFCEKPEHLILKLQDTLGIDHYRNPPESSFRRSAKEPETSEERRIVDIVRQVSTRSAYWQKLH